MNNITKSENRYVKALCLFFSLSFFSASITACAYLGVWDELFSDWIFILTSPSPLVTDYYRLGNMASTFFNAGMCSLACTLIMIFFDADCDVNTLAGFFLVIAHCFYGLNFLNMWPPMLGRSHMGFVVTFFILLFAALLVIGWYLNGKSFQGYRKLTASTGLNADFIDEFGFPLILINMGIYGFLILTYFSAVILLTEGAGFTGATTGVILAALTFAAKGQHPKNVWPILLGFVVLSFYVTTISVIGNRDVPWTLSTQLIPCLEYYGKGPAKK